MIRHLEHLPEEEQEESFASRRPAIEQMVDEHVLFTREDRPLFDLLGLSDFLDHDDEDPEIGTR